MDYLHPFTRGEIFRVEFLPSAVVLEELGPSCGKDRQQFEAIVVWQVGQHLFVDCGQSPGDDRQIDEPEQLAQACRHLDINRRLTFRESAIEIEDNQFFRHPHACKFIKILDLRLPSATSRVVSSLQHHWILAFVANHYFTSYAVGGFWFCTSALRWVTLIDMNVPRIDDEAYPLPIPWSYRRWKPSGCSGGRTEGRRTMPSRDFSIATIPIPRLSATRSLCYSLARADGVVEMLGCEHEAPSGVWSAEITSQERLKHHRTSRSTSVRRQPTVPHSGVCETCKC